MAGVLELSDWEFNTTAGNQYFAILKLPFWNIDFKLFIKKQKTQNEPLTLPSFCPRDADRETWFIDLPHSLHDTIAHLKT